MRVGYLGPAGTVSHEALLSTPRGSRRSSLPEPTLHEAVIAVHDGDVERALSRSRTRSRARSTRRSTRSPSRPTTGDRRRAALAGPPAPHRGRPARARQGAAPSSRTRSGCQCAVPARAPRRADGRCPLDRRRRAPGRGGFESGAAAIGTRGAAEPTAAWSCAGTRGRPRQRDPLRVDRSHRDRPRPRRTRQDGPRVLGHGLRRPGLARALPVRVRSAASTSPGSSRARARAARQYMFFSISRRADERRGGCDRQPARPPHEVRVLGSYPAA